MFKLYLNKGTITQIDKSEDRQDIIDTMGYFLNDDPETRFLIKEESEEYGDSGKRINGLVDYIKYAELYKPKEKVLKKNK